MAGKINRKLARKIDIHRYTMDGRVLINGVLEVQETPENLWRSLIFNAITTRAVKDVDTEKSSGKQLNANLPPPHNGKCTFI